MAKNRKEKDDAPVNLERVRVAMNKQYGDGTIYGGLGNKKDPVRIPTGIFAVDFAIGGGLTQHSTNCLWGPESGSKSSIALKAISSAAMICWRCFAVIEACKCSQKALKMKSVFANVEGTLDENWAECIGAKPDSYLAIVADYGEQYINICDTALEADDCGLLVVDSLAALAPESEVEAPSEDQFMGKQAAMIGRAMRKWRHTMTIQMKRGHPCAILCTNQMRKKIGVMFGDPETMSGGHAMFHEFSLVLRCVKKSLDKKGADARYVNAERNKEIASRHSFSIRKEKMLTLSGVGEFVIVKEDAPEHELRKGMIDDYKTVLNYAKEYGVVEKAGEKMKLFDGKTASKQEDVIKFWKKYDFEYLKAKMEIIKRAKARVKGE